MQYKDVIMETEQAIAIEMLRDFSRRMDQLVNTYGQVKLNKAANHPATQKDYFKKHAIELKTEIDDILANDKLDSINCLKYIDDIQTLIHRFKDETIYPRGRSKRWLACCACLRQQRSFTLSFQQHVAPTFSVTLQLIRHLADIPANHIEQVLHYICNLNMRGQNYRCQVMGDPLLRKNFQEVESKLVSSNLISHLAIHYDVMTVEEQKSLDMRLKQQYDRVNEELARLAI